MRQEAPRQRHSRTGIPGLQSGENVNYAVPTIHIQSELKRHFRRSAWTVRPPRRIQEMQSALAEARADLNPRDQRIVFLRLYKGWTQERVGEELGVTQMQVSRLLARILSTLRDQLTTKDAVRPRRTRVA